MSLETESRQVAIADKPAFLPARAADVLEVLLKRSGHVVSHGRSVPRSSGGSKDIESNALEVYVHRLRKVLDDAGATSASTRSAVRGYLLDLKKRDA